MFYEKFLEFRKLRRKFCRKNLRLYKRITEMHYIPEQTCLILEGWYFRNWYSSGPIYCIFDGFDIADESHRLISSSFPFAGVIPTVKTRILIRIRHEKNISKDFVGKLRISADGKLGRLLWGCTVSHRSVYALVRRVFAMNNFHI